MRFCETLGVAGPQIRLTADPAFTLKEADASWVNGIFARFGMTAEKRYFVVALRDWKENAAEKTAVMAKICDRISETWGLVPVFLPMHDPLDMEINRAAAAQCRCETVFLSGLTGSEMLGVLRRMEFVCAMRLHTLIYSAAVGTPSIGLAYDGKIRAFLELTEQPFILETPEEAQFLACVAALMEQREKISASLCAKNGEFRALAMRDAEEALALLGGDDT